MLNIIYYIAIFFLILWIITKWKFFKDSSISYKWIFLFFIFKVIVSFFLYGIYTLYYPNNRVDNDIFKYYDDGQILFHSLRDNPSNYLKMMTGIGDNTNEIKEKYYKKMNFWIKPYEYEVINENKTIIRLNAFINLFALNNYFINTLIFLFLSFIGLFAIFRVLSEYFTQNHLILAFFIFLIPSTAFWSSAILKESLVFFSLGGLLYSVNQYLKQITLKRILLILLFAIFLAYSKMYILIIALPAFISIILSKHLKNIKKEIIFILIPIIFIALYFQSEYFIPYNFSEITTAKQHDFINMINSFTNVGSKIEIPRLEDSFYSFLINTPNALLNSLFRPHIFEAHNFTSMLAAIENLFILIIMLLIPLFFKKNQFHIWMWFSLLFSIMLFILIGLTTPVLGALVRYKVPALPFLLYLLINFIDFNKIFFKIKTIWKKSSL
ncbi:MAG: hypothetical protein HPY79_02460 [Bacteroidales bacterium]|nr:hypothetical protein [Bacteroidales bacterium]